MNSLYLAAPLFTPEERAFNERLASLLAQKYTVFLPQRDGLLLPGATLTRVEFASAARRVFELDIAAIEAASVVFAVLDGRTIDEGVSFELGVGYALGKQCVGYRSDSRVLLPYGINPMIEGSLQMTIGSEAELERWVLA